MSVLRCEELGSEAKRVRVTMTQYGMEDDELVIDTTPRVMKLTNHADVIAGERVLEVSPELSNQEPFVGELCPHELKYLRGVPGFHFTRDVRFEVEDA